MLSAETDGDLLMGRVDPLDTGTFSTVSWNTIAVDPAFTGLVRDHWHVLVAGSHWVSYSIEGDDHLQLFKLAPADVVDGVAPSEVSVVTPPTEGGMVEDYITNDHFIVRRRNGIAVGVWDEPNQLIKIVVIDETLAYRTEAEVGGAAADGGAGVYISNGTSARGTGDPPGFHVLASTSLGAASEGSIEYLFTDRGWSDAGTTILTISETGYNLQMATVIVLPNQWTVITFKRVFVDSTTSLDGGDIVRHVYDDTGALDSEEYLLDSSSSGLLGNRPHTRAYHTGGPHYIITTWDEVDSGGGTVGCYMRVDRIRVSR